MHVQCISNAHHHHTHTLTLVIHTVHDGHQPLQPGHGLSLIALRHKVWTEPRDHALQVVRRRETQESGMEYVRVTVPGRKLFHCILQLYCCV